MSRNGLVFYDNYAIYQRIAECAYFKWLAGSQDTLKNWLDAEKEVFKNC